MRVWNQVPLLRLLLPFLIGIITAICIPISSYEALCLLSLMFTIVAATVLVPKWSLSYKKAYFFGVLIFNSLFFCGYQLTLYKTEKKSPNHFSHHLNTNNWVKVRLIEHVIEKNKTVKAFLEVSEVKNHKGVIPTMGKAIAYIEKNKASAQLNYGDELIMQANFVEIAPPQNSKQFDYKKYLAFKNIYHQVYVKCDDWKKVGINSGNVLIEKSLKLRDKLLKMFVQNNLSGDEFSVASALLIGYTDKLDKNLIASYANTGTLHVLSVSGLHVGIIYIVLNWLLFFFDKLKNGYVLKTILLILCLWLYATLTGLSPAVLRATTMFSFVVIGKAFKQYVNIYNVLLASVFLLLLIDPYLIMDVGFQLSYLSVVGIVYLQPKIYNWCIFDNWLFDQIWKITTVSIAAQIATFPLCLYYFHQFPNYFLISNLLVIPLSTIVIGLGIFAFVFSSFSIVAHYLFYIFSNSLKLLNFGVKILDALPYSTMQGISINIFEMLLLYVMIICFVLFFIKRYYNYLLCGLISIVLLLSFRILEQFF